MIKMQKPNAENLVEGKKVADPILKELQGQPIDHTDKLIRLVKIGNRILFISSFPQINL